ncbi:class I SAM-dependent methyltransferase [Arthrospiribacter ruber]|uniref:Class I SAM-dependent methyltransferase n=1 Tax=Arthrospiribacter ruber TaxID=2487934 RepID=A0A951MF09_9BACT|nr:class I SAM-dependent methyltransferase [Arthrospiribacter ruber]MBW3469572.1 class I SAM-dependent methyltransferase [Arthrospiribacter ruber]
MKNIEIFENERASNYDGFVSIWIPGYDYFLNQFPKILPHFDPKSILVAGCGTGNEIIEMIKSGKGWEITGIDPSPEMISQAKGKLQSNPNVQLLEGEVSDLPDSEQFDTATLFLVLHFLKDDGGKLNLLKEIGRRMKTGSPIFLLDITGSKSMIRKNLKLLKYHLPIELDKEIIQKRLERIENDLHYVTEKRLKKLLELAGFKNPTRFYQSTIYQGWVALKSS